MCIRDSWYTVQAQEEQDHAMLFIQYLQQNGIPVTLEAIAKPDKVFHSPMDPLLIGAEHERYVTSLIHDIYEAAYTVRDFLSLIHISPRTRAASGSSFKHGGRAGSPRDHGRRDTTS